MNYLHVYFVSGTHVTFKNLRYEIGGDLLFNYLIEFVYSKVQNVSRENIVSLKRDKEARIFLL